METQDVVKTLEMLAAGCSPATGEVLNNESVLNERDVIRALQIAIEHLQRELPAPTPSTSKSLVEIDDKDIKAAIQLFLEQDNTPTENRLTGFFLAARAFKNQVIVSNELYGKYKRQYTKGQLQDFFADYLVKKGYVHQSSAKNDERRSAPWDRIDFFHQDAFNKLSPADINLLKENVNKLGVTKTDDIAEYIKAARKRFARAYEPWSETEKQLLSEALKLTNNLEVLTECFQRGEGAIMSCGKRLIYEGRVE